MSQMPKPPIYIYEPADLSVFSSVESAERYIEPPEIRSNACYFYDAEGAILEGTVFKDQRGIEQCKLTESPDKRARPEELRRIIIEFLEYLEYNADELN